MNERRWQYLIFIVLLVVISGCGRKPRPPLALLTLGRVRSVYARSGYEETSNPGKLVRLIHENDKVSKASFLWKERTVFFIKFEKNSRKYKDYILYQKTCELEDDYTVIGGMQRIDFDSPLDLTKLPSFFEPVLHRILTEKSLDQIKSSEEKGQEEYNRKFTAKKDGSASGEVKGKRFTIDFCTATGYPWARKILPTGFPSNYSFDFESYE